MAEPFLGEIKLFSFPFPPRGWARCEGQLMSIAQNQALFSILGTTYGGNGITAFALPDLRGRVPVGPGQQVQLGQIAGEEAHALHTGELPAHSHAVYCNEGSGVDKAAAGNTWAKSASNPYGNTVNATMSPEAIATAGNGQPHSNMQPYAVTNYCIALEGIFPSRN